LPRYIVTRLVTLVPLLLGVSLLTFLLAHLAPGDPISTQFGLDPRGMDVETMERLRDELGLNDPLPVQYWNYLRNLLQGDMGNSISTRSPVSDEILARLPATIELALAAIILVLLIAIPLGIISAVKRGSITDHLAMGGALLGVSMPAFWFGIMLMLLLSLRLRWLPSGGRGDGSLVGSIKALIMPAFTLAVGMMGLVTRIMRSSMLEVLGQDYMRTARAKGLAQRAVLARHGLRNSLIPVVTIVGIQFAALLGGTIIVETIFAWPGIGRLAVNAIWRRDYPVIMGTVLVFSTTFVIVNLLVDVLYTLIDPRIRYD
jgi:ABC-type dipeptide/oligopeptide/nickel transport system permease component